MRTTEADAEQLARDGDYFLKRDRNKAGTISIYTCKPVTSSNGRSSNQTVRVAPTDTSDPAVAEIALKRFVLNSKEAKQKEREEQASGKAPSQAIDRRILEVMNFYYLGHAEKKSAARTVRSTMKAVEDCWPDNPPCSTLDREKQKEFVAFGRERGWTDNTIAHRLNFIWAAMHWCDSGKRLAKVYPRKIPTAQWEANLESSNEGAFELDELGRLFIAAQEDPCHWRYMVTAIASGARPGAVIDLEWPQLDFRHRICKLNPEGRRQTKKRRAKVPMCPTFFNEASAWTHDSERVIGLLSTSHWVSLSKKADVTGGPMRVRHTVRTWLAEQRVPDAEADIFVGHAEEGSDTGRRWYKHLRPDYLLMCAEAIETLFIEIARRTGVRFAGMKRPQPTFAELIDSWKAGAANDGLFDTQTWNQRGRPGMQVIDSAGEIDNDLITR